MGEKGKKGWKELTPEEIERIFEKINKEYEKKYGKKNLDIEENDDTMKEDT